MPGLSLEELNELLMDEDELDDAQIRRKRRKEEKQRARKRKPRPDEDINN